MQCGIDLGSRSVKIALVGEGGLQEGRILETVPFYREFGVTGPEGLVVDFAALGLGAPEAVVATGYGRNTLRIAGAQTIAELKAHMLGAIWQTQLQDFTLLDLGGQDSKVIKVRQGRMADFATNDKCAASTGRYLENMAAVLGVSVAQLGGYAEEPVELSSTCAIFGESELIGRIVEGHPLPALAAGVNYTIFKRIRPLLGPLLSDILVFTGGVAHSSAIRHFLETELPVQVVVPPEPQLNGAIGCAVYQQTGRR